MYEHPDLIIATCCTVDAIDAHHNRAPPQHKSIYIYIYSYIIYNLSQQRCLFVSAACVNCVRWSNNGLYLASGGDDKLVMVWKRAAYVHTQTHTHTPIQMIYVLLQFRLDDLESDITFSFTFLIIFIPRTCPKSK